MEGGGMTEIVRLERALLRSMMDLGDEAVSLALDAGLEPDDFIDGRHRRVYQEAVRLWEDEAPVNQAAMVARLGGPTKALAEIFEADVIPAGRIRGCACLVKDKAMLRRLASATRRVAHLATAPDADPAQVLDEAQRAVSEVATGGDFSAVHVGKALSSIIRERGDGGEEAMIRTGFTGLDRLLGGLRPGGLYLVAGRTGAGKTSLLLSIAGNMAIDGGHPVLFVSKEQNEKELSGLLLCQQAEMDTRRWAMGNLKNPEEEERLRRAVFRLSDAPIHWFPCRGRGEAALREVKACARGLKMRKGLRVVMIDYLQLFAAYQSPEDISDISQGFKNLAMDLDVVVVAACQLNRAIDYREEKKPVLADLKGSGSLEQDADAVVFICPPETFEEDENLSEMAVPMTVDLVVAKNRGGPKGEVPVEFYPWCVLFHD